MYILKYLSKKIVVLVPVEDEGGALGIRILWVRDGPPTKYCCE